MKQKKYLMFLILLMIPMYVFASGEVNISTDSITVSQEDTESFTINNDEDKLVKLPAPLYKSFGTITLKSNTIDDISNLKIYVIFFNGKK